MTRSIPGILFPIICVSLVAEPFKEQIQPVLQKHCVACHGKDGKVKGKVNLLEIRSAKDLVANPELLESVIGVLEDGEMPPEDEPELPADVRKALVKNLVPLLDKALAESEFAHTPIRRMNRFQYNNAVVDLLELDRNIFRLNERFVRRYDNYFQPKTGKMPNAVKVASWPLSKDRDGHRPEGFRGVTPFPQDQRAEHGFDNRADHLTLSPLLMESFLALSQSIVESPDLNPRECRSWNTFFAEPGKPSVQHDGKFDAENKNWIKVTNSPKERVWTQHMRPWGAENWGGGHHLIWMSRKAGIELELGFETKAAGDGLRVGFTKAPDYGIFELLLDGEPIGKAYDLFDPKVVRAKDVRIPFKVSPGQHRLTIRCTGKNEKSKSFLFAIDELEVTGTSEETKPEPVTQDVAGALRQRIPQLLRRAFRRPAEPATLQKFIQFAERNLSSGTSYEDTMRTITGAALATPDFLYFYESEGNGQVDDYELASRLALFFWGSIPDDALLDVAGSGKLKDEKVLSAEIDRMLNDPKASRFCDAFAGQWLQMDQLVTAVPDPKKYPWFYYNGYRSSMHMMLEPLLLFETVFIENRSVTELLDPDFTWESAMLASNYKGQGNNRQDKVLDFKRVPVTDKRRGGVITNAAVMTMTSAPDHTLPIIRGTWLNTVIFNDPPEPPPADVPPLPKPNEEELAKLTIRERFAEHRKRADCAGCHNKIDPLGFALENYDPTGVWRDNYENGRKVDASGELFNRYKFDGAVEFKEVLLKEKHRFFKGFTSHLLTFALGRELTPADSPAIQAITQEALNGDDRFRNLLKRIAMSEPFLHKNTQSKEKNLNAN